MTERLLALVMLLAWSSPADAGRIHHEAVTLDALLTKGVQYILVVKPAEPPSRQVTIPVKGGACGETCPPFTVQVSRYVIGEVIAAPAEVKGLVGQTIEVSPAQVGFWYGMHWQYYVDGVSKSPIVPVYEPAKKGEPMKDPTGFIVFLARDGDERRGDLKDLPPWSFLLEGAVEGIGMKATILEKLKK
jgi:hypothetical protein